MIRRIASQESASMEPLAMIRLMDLFANVVRDSEVKNIERTLTTVRSMDVEMVGCPGDVIPFFTCKLLLLAYCQIAN